MATDHNDDAPPANEEPSTLTKRLDAWNQARLDEHVSTEIQRLRKRGNVTLAEWMESNSWEREHLYPALTDEALAHVVEHNLKNCFRRSVPSSTYEDALSQHLAPLMLERFKAMRAVLKSVPAELAKEHAGALKDAYARGRCEAIEEAAQAVASLPRGTWGDERGERSPWPVAVAAIRSLTGGQS